MLNAIDRDEATIDDGEDYIFYIGWKPLLCNLRTYVRRVCAVQSAGSAVQFAI